MQKKQRGYYFTSCTYKKINIFLHNIFWGVDSNSEIQFFGQHWKTPYNLEKKNSRLSKFSSVGEKKTSELDSASQKTLY